MNHSNEASTANDLTEASMAKLLETVRTQVLSMNPVSLVVTQEGIDWMKSLTDADPEFKARVLAEFPQMAAVLA
jgi:hypothetical protein